MVQKSEVEFYDDVAEVVNHFINEDYVKQRTYFQSEEINLQQNTAQPGTEIGTVEVDLEVKREVPLEAKT